MLWASHCNALLLCKGKGLRRNGDEDNRRESMDHVTYEIGIDYNALELCYVSCVMKNRLSLREIFGSWCGIGIIADTCSRWILE